MSTRPNLEVTRGGERLNSWKEIATYLSRNERTVRRWEEKEGLHVHRLVHEKRGSVYAYRSELDAWWASRRESPEFIEAPPVSPKAAGWGARHLAAGLLAVAIGAAAFRLPAPRAAGPDSAGLHPDH